MFLLVLFMLGTASQAITTPAVDITMIASDSLSGPTFDSVTYGKDIMVLFWESGNQNDRMFKTSAWDMLATEKAKHVTRPIVIADMDCSILDNKEFCSKWIAFNTTGLEYPYIALSYYNEPFKQYNGSMAYPSLTNFLYEYFERNCVLNEKWCTEEEREYLDNWDFMSLEQLMEEHILMTRETKGIVKTFEMDAANMRDEFRRMHTEVTNLVEERDKIALLLHTVIQKYGVDAIEELANEYKHKEAEIRYI